MRVSLYLKLLPLYIGLAALVASPFYMTYKHDQQVLATAKSAQQKLQEAPQEEKIISGKPVRIVLPDVGIDLPVVEGKYISAEKGWSVSPVYANYAVNTYPINNSKGTTLIYGHALIYVFGRTQNLKPGNTALVYTDNGHIFQFRFTNSRTVNPSDTELFSQLNTNRPILKLMTCGGSWSQNRRIMNFELAKAA